MRCTADASPVRKESKRVVGSKFGGFAVHLLPGGPHIDLTCSVGRLAWHREKVHGGPRALGVLVNLQHELLVFEVLAVPAQDVTKRQ